MRGAVAESAATVHGRTRALARLLLITLVAALVASSTLVLAPAAPAAASSHVPRPTPPPITVAITPGGFAPEVVTAVVGQTVRFVNEAGAPHSVVANDGAFDSGTITPTGAFTLSVGAPGSFAFGSASDASFGGLLTVGLLDLPGPASALVGGNLPDLGVPPMADPDAHPSGIGASRSRIVVGLDPAATLGDANDAFAAAGVTVVGSAPGISMVVVQVDPLPAVGDFAALEQALDVLRAHPAVRAATMDKVVSASIVVPPTDSNGPTDWIWDDDRRRTGAPPVGTDGNWGLESARFPSAWNVLDTVRRRNPSIDTVVYDQGFDPTHPELSGAAVVGLCSSDDNCTDTPGELSKHGNHVAGIIGATFDNDGAEPGTTVGISGGNPVADMSLVSWYGNFEYARVPDNGPSYEEMTSTSANWALWDKLLDEKRPGGAWPDLRVVSMSAITMFLNDGSTSWAWGANNAGFRCGPDEDDDADGDGPCTPNTSDRFLRDVANDGELARLIAEDAADKNVLLAVAAGNDSIKVCDNGTSTAAPVSKGGPCPPGYSYSVLDTRRLHAFGWASAHWESGPNPIVMVESINALHQRSLFSNVGGDVAAPGQAIRSLDEADVDGTPGYRLDSGTSMATPHVAALAGWLAAVAPSLTVEQLRDAILAGARTDTLPRNDEPVAPRIDAYASLLRVPGVVEMLADLADATADGNRRVVRNRDGTTSEDRVDITLVRGLKTHSAPDGRVDMRDFRRFRDALLQICRDVPGTIGCPTGTIVLDGTDDHPKKDLNHDGCVNDPAVLSCKAEDTWSRYDLNGDGLVSPARLESLVVGTGTAEHSDLSLFQSVFATSEGWQPTDLPNLLRSGDLEIHADPLFAAGAKSVDVEVRYGSGRTLAPARAMATKNGIVATVPTVDAGQPIEVVGRATIDGQVVESAIETLTLRHGEDARVDLCIPHVEATVDDDSLIADNEDTARVHATFRRCNDDPVDGETVTFALHPDPGVTPFSGDGPAALDAGVPDATLSDTEAVTDESGRA
ncbi:MAG TPA: S8 family serine peptidase, partial [Acidimicrobiia bacterium]|nr:S8 family serine peptidase [Acidimicrobiia bacterium]